MSLKLFLLAPQAVFKARANNPGSYAYPIRDLEYDTVTLGTYSNIWPNQTVFLGSTEGASDLGVTRVRTPPDSHTLPIGLSAQGNRYGEINPMDNCYITVLSDWRVWPKIPRIDADGTRYMDADLSWATYGQYSPPVANAGAAYVGTIDPGTSKITVNFTASNSFTTHPGATIASYGWAVGDGTITVGTSASSSITATFPAGFRWVTLGVADSNSQFHYCHVPVLAIDPNADPCINNFLLERHAIRPDGQEMTVRIRQNIPAATYPDNTLALVFDGEPASAGDRSNLLLMGWIEQEPTEIDATETGTLKDVSLSIVDVAGRLKSLPGFPQILEHVASPAKWGEMNSPNMNRYLHFLLQWQTTALDLADYTPAPTGSSYTFKVLGSDGASLFEQVNRRAQALIPDHLLTCDTKGALRVLPDPLLQATADRTSMVQVTLDAGDYSNLTYTQQRHPRVHWLRSNAILIGTSSIDTAFCIAPGSSPGWGESAQDDGEHLALSQSDLNTVTGHRYARLNAPQGAFRLTLAEGSRQGIEPALMTWVRLTIPATAAAQRGLTLTNERGLVQQIDVRYQSTRTGLTKTYTLTWERESSGPAATTVEVEAAEPVDTGGWNTPPVIVEDPQFNNGLVGGDVMAFVDNAGNIYTTSNFTAGTPTWARNASANAAVGGLTIRGFVVDPFSPGYRGTGSAINAYVITVTRLWRLNDIFGTPSYTSLYTFTEATSSSGEWASVGASFGRFFPDEADNPWLLAAQSHRSVGGQNGTYIVHSEDAGATISSEIRPSTFTQSISTGQGTAIPAVWLSPRTPGFALVGSYKVSGSTPTGGLYKTTDWGATWSEATEYAATLGVGLGFCFHVPWEDNDDESILYYSYWDRISSQFNYRLYRSQGGTSTDISPTDSGKKFAPIRPNFGIRSLDTDRLQLVVAGVANSSDNVDPGGSGTDAVAAIFVSSDGGDTWTRRTTAVAASVNGNWFMQVAFASGNANIIYAWGNDGYIAYSTDNGATFTGKEPTNVTASTTEVVGICGGPL